MEKLFALIAILVVGVIVLFVDETGSVSFNKKKNKLEETVKDVVNSLGSVAFFQQMLDELRGTDTNVLPVNDITETLDLYIDIKILSLTAFDEISGEVTLVTSMKLTWDASNTPRWDPVTSLGGKESVSVGGGMLWKPKLLLLNPARSVQDLTQLSDKLRMFSNGTVEWNVISAIEASCSVDISLFPFDTQICTINIATWGYTSSEINLIGSFKKADLPFFRENNVWELLDLHVTTGHEEDIAFVAIALHFRRHWQYFMVNILLAPVLLSFLSPCVFLLPASSGERISFAITCFLAFGVFSGLLAASIPRSSAPVAQLCYMLMSMTIQSFGVAFCTILSLRMYGASEDTRPPSCIRAVVKLLSARRVEQISESCPADKRCKGISSNAMYNENGEVRQLDKLPFPDDQEGTGSSIEAEVMSELESDKGITWKDVTCVVDYVFFVVFTGSMLISIVAASYALLIQ